MEARTVSSSHLKLKTPTKGLEAMASVTSLGNVERGRYETSYNYKNLKLLQARETLVHARRPGKVCCNANVRATKAR